VTGEFFSFAFTAALNPKLLALDLTLIENCRARAMFACILAAGPLISCFSEPAVELHGAAEVDVCWATCSFPRRCGSVIAGMSMSWAAPQGGTTRQ